MPQPLKFPFISIESEARYIQISLNEINMSIPFVIALFSLMVLRYIGGEFADDTGAYRLFGGIFMLFALFARSIFN